MKLSVYLFTAAAFLLSIVMMPLIIKFCKFYSLYDTVNARKIHSGNVPRLGGAGIVISFIICAVICFYIDKGLSFYNVMPLLISGLIIFCFGIIDDIFELQSIIKLYVQILATGIVVCNGFCFKQILGLQLPRMVGIILTFGWVLGLINAYNLIDGLDGLCGTLSGTVFLTLGFLFLGSFKEGAAICFILAAAVIGFLIFNWPPAKIFMGDGGSQFLGFMVATIPLYTSSERFEFNKFPIMILLVSFPLFDTVAAIWRRLRDHRPIMSPDRLHLHHKLLNLGYSKKSALYLILAVQILICITVYLSVYLEGPKGTILIIVAGLFMFGFFSAVHYMNRLVLNGKCTGSEPEDKTPEL